MARPRRVSSSRSALSLLAFALGLGVAVPVAGQAQDRWWARDKAQHYGASIALTVGGHTLSAVWLQEPWQRAITGVSVGLGAGVAKEVYDMAGYGDPSWRDLTWDLAGVATGVGLALLVDILWLDEPSEQGGTTALAMPAASAMPMALRVKF